MGANGAGAPGSDGPVGSSCEGERTIMENRRFFVRKVAEDGMHAMLMSGLQFVSQIQGQERGGAPRYNHGNQKLGFN